MVQTEENKRRAQKRWERKDKVVRRYVDVITEGFRYADLYVWTSEKLWKYRQERVLGSEAYIGLPYSDKRYLDGVWDTLNKLHEQKNHVWTHVLDGERFDTNDPAWRERKNERVREINTDTSYFCFKRTVDGVTFFVPVREKDREAEYVRDEKLAVNVARLA